MTNTCPASSSTSTMVWSLFSCPRVVSGGSFYQIALTIAHVQISCDFSSRCTEGGGEVELQDAMSLGSLALGKPPFLGVVLIGALGISTSEISPPSRWEEEIHNSSKMGGSKGSTLT